MPKHLDKVILSLAGEFFVASELCRRGYLASLTLKNYPKVDIFTLDPETQRQTAIQVKSVRYSKNPQFFVPEDAASYPGLFVFVIIGAPTTPAQPAHEVFILPGETVARVATKARDDYLAKHPSDKPQPFMVSRNDLLPYQDRWDLLEPVIVATAPVHA